ncbi:hypothetical protein Tco_1460802, partial [Tanacetum coccineum]
IMADVNALIEQAPALAPPTRTDEKILPHIRWVPIGKSNCYLDAEKSQSNPIYKIAVDILKHTNFLSTLLTVWVIQNKLNTYLMSLLMTCFNHGGHSRKLATIINLCLTGKTSGFERPRALVLQIFWGIVNRAHIDYAERLWEEFTQSIHTFTEDKRKGTTYSGEEESNSYPYPKYQKKKRKPVSESSDAPPLAKRAKAGKVLKKRTAKSSKQLVDEFIDEGVLAAEPRLEDTEEEILEKVLQESLTDAYPTQ